MAMSPDVSRLLAWKPPAMQPARLFPGPPRPIGEHVMLGDDVEFDVFVRNTDGVFVPVSTLTGHTY